MQSPVPPTEELIFERLLAGLLERGSGPAEEDGVDAPPDLIELRNMARRLRASVQWMPLPRSRLALRRALLATVEAARSRPAARHRERYIPAAWRRTGRWLTAVTAATFLMFGAALGAHALEMALSPAGGLYGIAQQIDAMRVQLAGDAMHRAAMLVEVSRARAAEIGAMAYDDDPRGVEEAATALERQNQWLRRVASSLPPADRQRLAPAAARSDALVAAARRVARLRMSGLLPPGVTMSYLLSAASGPLSGAGMTDVSTSSNPREDSVSGGSGSGTAPSVHDTAGGGPSREPANGAGAASRESQKSGGAGDAAQGSGSSGSASSGSQAGASTGDRGGAQGGHGNGGSNGSGQSDTSREGQR